ncbi:MAG: HI0074 family nucleotidyltransferase substrate-binding subunit [bacterium]|nr:HI0074 family nucleotidyltransferase substrate-binding subunit [bacterium]
MNSMHLMDDYDRALARLAEALRVATDDDVYRAGCIQYFEFCFELAWKTIKTFAEQAGVLECTSPKASIKHAFSAGWIDDEDTWLAMLAARNRMTHTYDMFGAFDVYDSLPRFLSEMQHLHGTLTAAQTA